MSLKEINATNVIIDALSDLSAACIAIGKAVEQTDGEERPSKTASDARTLIGVATKACGIDWVISTTKAKPLDEAFDQAWRIEIVKIVERIHLSFGAPGDWGYEHPIGAALARLYSAYNSLT